MDIAKIHSRFKTHENMFRCPKCKTEMAFRNENSLVCSSGHCFDLSRHGYINFLPTQGKTKYTKELFKSRRSIFLSGFYDPLTQFILSLLDEYAFNLSIINLLDAGCGEGSLTQKILEGGVDAGKIFGLDIVKDAVLMAAREYDEEIWVVGDLSNIPLRSNSMDVLLNIFSPANYGEFLRVMDDDGFLIKVIPGKRYLAELRECAGGQLIKSDYSNESVQDFFCENMICLDKRHLYYQMPLNDSHLENFVQMTPMMFNVDRANMRLEGIDQITIEMVILVGKKRCPARK